MLNQVILPMENSETFDFKNIPAELMMVLKAYWAKFLFLIPNLLAAAFILFVTLWLAAKVQALLKHRLQHKAHDQITVQYIALASKWAVLIIGILLVLNTLGMGGVAGGLLASAGLSAFVIGFAFKDIAENFLAGLILAFNRPFEVNDTISVNDLTGQVLGLNVRTTHIRTFDSKDIFIPNGIILKSSVTNLTINGRIRQDFVVGIDYDNDIQQAITLIERIAASIEDVLQDKPPYAAVEELAVNSVNIRVFFWSETGDYKKGVVVLKGHVMQAVKEALLQNGFGMPANIQEVKLYNLQKSFPIQLLSPPDGKAEAEPASS